MKNILQAARHVVVEGPIGVGKTALVHRLAAHLNARCLVEQPELNPFLGRFYQDPSRHALPTQMHFLFQRIDQLRELAAHDWVASPLISDYLLEKDLLFAQLNLNDEEYALYQQLWLRLSPQPPVPDLVIYLQAQPETLIARVRRRGLDSERRIADSYLTLLAERYSRFFYHYSAAPVMVVNSENLNFADSDEDFQLLAERIESMRGQRGYFNRGD